MDWCVSIQWVDRQPNQIDHQIHLDRASTEWSMCIWRMLVGVVHHSRRLQGCTLGLGDPSRASYPASGWVAFCTCSEPSNRPQKWEPRRTTLPLDPVDSPIWCTPTPSTNSELVGGCYSRGVLYCNEGSRWCTWSSPSAVWGYPSSSWPNGRQDLESHTHPIWNGSIRSRRCYRSTTRSGRIVLASPGDPHPPSTARRRYGSWWPDSTYCWYAASPSSHDGCPSIIVGCGSRRYTRNSN